ncbi:hypothetical protein IJ732_06690, partial [bacterium]|nr:hypothetical protein [bacterium]
SHYLKMNNILSNALKNTEATEQTKFYKLSETDFKSKFESHLKTTGCDADAGDTNFTPNVCLADGSQFAYGIFDESCTDNICDTLTIDTNGKKGPNTAGKDRFTINLTPNGLKALGESDTCSTGLDCGAYILAHHKLWTGEVEIAQADPEPVIPEGCEDAECSSCSDGYWGYNSSCVKTKTLADNSTGYKIGDIYVSEIVPAKTFSGSTYWQGASDVCTAKGMVLPDRETLSTFLVSNPEYVASIKEAQEDPLFWTIEPAEDCSGCYYFSNTNGAIGYFYGHNSSASKVNVICVEDKN